MREKMQMSMLRCEALPSATEEEPSSLLFIAIEQLERLHHCLPPKSQLHELSHLCLEFSFLK